MTLVEVMVSAALVSVMAFAMMTGVEQLKKSSKLASVMETRDAVGQTIYSAVTSPAALYWSARQSVNSAFASCILGNVGASACVGDQNFPLVIFQPSFSTTTAPVALTGALNLNVPAAGGNQVLYNFKTGQPCLGTTAPNPQCRFSVAASFKAICPTLAFMPQATCQQAESVEITYTIQDTAAPAATNTMALKTVGVNRVIIPTSLIALYKTQDNTQNALLGCPLGTVAIGFGGEGNIICQKLDWVCPAGTLTVGLDSFGRPIYRPGSFNSGKGAFDNLAQVMCVNVSCGNSLMTSLTGGTSASNIAASCFSQTFCANEGLESSINPPQVLIDILSNGVSPVPQCQPLQNSCYQNDPTGLGGLPNFTSSIPTYNGSGANLVTSICKSWGCPVGQYMNSWAPDGLCGAAAAAPPPPVPTTIPPSTCSLPLQPNPCDDIFTTQHFASTCTGGPAAVGATCTYYDGCIRFDASSGGAKTNVTNAGYKWVDLPGGKATATACTGFTKQGAGAAAPDEDGYACQPHVLNATCGAAPGPGPGPIPAPMTGACAILPGGMTQPPSRFCISNYSQCGMGGNFWYPPTGVTCTGTFNQLVPTQGTNCAVEYSVTCDDGQFTGGYLLSTSSCSNTNTYPASFTITSTTFNPSTPLPPYIATPPSYIAPSSKATDPSCLY
ncbi:MAG: hypothetical protein V4736_01705 [Bdellovibrionota bacterium]